MFMVMFGTVVIAGIIGYAAENSGFVDNGYIPSIIIAVGGAFLFFFVQLMFGFGFSSPGMNAIVSSVGSLIIVPTHWRR